MISFFNSSLRIRKSPSAIAPRKDIRRAADGTPIPTPAADTEPAKPASNGDNGLSRLAKLAPSEVMTVYLAGKSVFAKPDSALSLQVFAGAMLALCVLWRWSTTHEEGKATQWGAIASASISFGLWVCAADGKLIFGAGFTPAMAGFIALLWTLILAPIVNKGD